jgi:hypothetical protein
MFKRLAALLLLIPSLALAVDLTPDPKFVKTDELTIIVQQVNPPCNNKDWDNFDWGMQIAGQTLIVVDTLQTTSFTRRGVREMNPLLGHHPNSARIRSAFVIGSAGWWLGSYVLPKPWRTVFQSIVVGAESYVVFSNGVYVKAGLAIPF